MTKKHKTNLIKKQFHYKGHTTTKYYIGSGWAQLKQTHLHRTFAQKAIYNRTNKLLSHNMIYILSLGIQNPKKFLILAIMSRLCHFLVKRIPLETLLMMLANNTKFQSTLTFGALNCWKTIRSILTTWHHQTSQMFCFTITNRQERAILSCSKYWTKQMMKTKWTMQVPREGSITYHLTQSLNTQKTFDKIWWASWLEELGFSIKNATE